LDGSFEENRAKIAGKRMGKERNEQGGSIGKEKGLAVDSQALAILSEKRE
jgi:hypothetical protein